MIESLYIVPRWFFDFDLILGVAFALLTFIIAAYSSRIYALTREREFRLFAFAFISLSASYIIRIWLNAFSTASVSTSEMLEISSITLSSIIAVYIYVFLFITGYVTLAYTTLKVKGKRTYLLMLVPALLTFILSKNNSLAIYLITSFFALTIVFHYSRLYIRTRDKKRLAMFLATVLLLVSNVIFMFITDYLFYKGYIISALIELLAYLIMGFSLYKITYGQETK